MSKYQNHSTLKEIMGSPALLLKIENQYKLILELLPNLSSAELAAITNAIAELQKQVLLTEGEDTRAVFDIDKNNNNYYAYLRHWGRQEYLNLYLGPIRILEGVTYRLTHKQTKETKIVRGLGLRREGEQVLLDIEHLFPAREIKSYVFYDWSEKLPPLVRQRDIDPLFGRKYWRQETWNG